MPANSVAARPFARNPFVHTAMRSSVAAPANDDSCGTCDDQILRAALLHFATHGLGAAQAAFAEAERAREAGDRQAAAAWTGICAALDKRLAADLAGRVGAVSS